MWGFGLATGIAYISAFCSGVLCCDLYLGLISYIFFFITTQILLGIAAFFVRDVVIQAKGFIGPPPRIDQLIEVVAAIAMGILSIVVAVVRTWLTLSEIWDNISWVFLLFVLLAEVLCANIYFFSQLPYFITLFENALGIKRAGAAASVATTVLS
jgi:hypothetical protein